MRPRLEISLFLMAAVLPFLPASAGAQSTPEDFFLGKVRPLLDTKCMACHGGDPEKIKSGFDLSTRVGALAGGDSGTPAIVPGKPEDSPFYLSTTWADPNLEMPPKEDDRLDEAQQAILHQWILDGAVWAEADAIADTGTAELAVHAREEGIVYSGLGGLDASWNQRPYNPEDLWAYQPVQRPNPPVPDSPIDSFINRKLADAGVTPAPRADKRALIRRVTFDLTGLPPTAEEIDAFLADGAPDAFEKIVDRLLASPRYGEQWARHWLDVVRYADTSGYANDFERPNAWRYRDYVIRALNNDKPYDQFVREQIAGDELGPANPEMLVATGFLRMGPWEHTAMSVAAETRQLFLDDVTNSVGETFLAHGMRCASCHDHKFDPIPTEDYYRMQAAFAPAQLAERQAPFLDAENKNGFDAGRTRIKRLIAETQKKLNAIRQRESAAIQAWLEDRGKGGMSVADAKRLPEDERPPRNLGLSYDDLGTQKVWNKQLQQLQQELKRYEPIAYSVYDGPVRTLNANARDQGIPENTDGALQDTFVLEGGSVEAPAHEVSPGVLRAVAPFVGDLEVVDIPPSRDSRRVALAAWITDPRNPLTARVMVNRVWQYHFGRGIAATPNNFGKMGKKPTHPELLDWLAAQFVAEGWSLKRLHKQILLSDAYQRASGHPDLEKLRQVDSDNTLLAYFSPRRLRAEELRDAMLFASGELNLEMGGVPAWPEINMEAALQPRHIMGSVAAAYQPSPTPEQRNRRSIYTMHIRTLRNPMLEVFNQPNPDVSCEMRDASTVTPQVFGLFNSQNSYSRALALAVRAKENASDAKIGVTRAFRYALGRDPEITELARGMEHLAAQTRHHETHPPVARNFPKEIRREMVEEMTGVNFSWIEKLDVYEEYKPDVQPTDVDAATRALADICLVLMNTNEFAYVY